MKRWIYIAVGNPGTVFFYTMRLRNILYVCKKHIYIYIYVYDTDTNDQQYTRHQRTFHFYVHGFRTQRPQACPWYHFGLEPFIFASTLPLGYFHVLSGKNRGWKTILSLLKWPLFRKHVKKC